MTLPDITPEAVPDLAPCQPSPDQRPLDGPPFDRPEVAAAFEAFPESCRGTLLDLRAMIFEEAARLGVGPLSEALKWGQPAYLTAKTKAGSTIRLGVPKGAGACAIYTHCQTSLIRDFAAAVPGRFTIEGNRAVHVHGPAPEEIRLLIAQALTYHRR